MAKQKRQVDVDIKVDDKEVDALLVKLGKVPAPIEDATSSAKELTGQLGKANKQIKETGNSNAFKKLFTSAVAGVTAYIGSLKVAKMALAGATMGLSLIVGAIATIGGAFTRTKSGSEALRRVTATIQVAFQMLGERAEVMYLKIKKAFEDPNKAIKEFGSLMKEYIMDKVQDIISAFGSLGKAIKAVFEGDWKTALAEVKSSFDKVAFGTEVAKYAKLEAELEAKTKYLKAQQELLKEVRSKTTDPEEVVTTGGAGRTVAGRSIKTLSEDISKTLNQIAKLNIELEKLKTPAVVEYLKTKEEFTSRVEKTVEAAKTEDELASNLAELILALGKATDAEALLQQKIDDGTLSLEERKRAALELYGVEKDNEGASLKRVKAEEAIAQARLNLIQKQYDTADYVTKKRMMDSLADAQVALSTAKNNIELQRALNLQTLRELDFEYIDLRITEEVDLYDNLRTIQERALSDESKTLTERKAILDGLMTAATETFQRQVKEFDAFLDSDKIDKLSKIFEIEDVGEQTTALKNLGLSKDVYERLLEVIRERRTITSELNEAEVELGSNVKRRYEDLLLFEKTKGKFDEELKDAKLDIAYEEDLELFKDALTAKLITQEQYNQSVKLLEEQYLENKTELAADWKIKSDKEEAKELKEEQDRLDRLRRIGADTQRLKEEDLYKAWRDELSFIEQALADGILLEEEATNKRLQLNEKYKEDSLQLEKELRDEKLAILSSQVNGSLDVVSQGIDAVNALYDLRLTNIDEEEKAGKISEERAEELRRQAFEDQKKFSIAQTAIQTLQGAQSAFTSLATIPVIGVGLGIAAAATAGIAGAARIAQIKRQTYDGAGDTSSGDTGQSVDKNPVANANFFGIGNESQSVGARNQRVGNRQENDRVLRAVVLESDITDSQIRTNNLIRRSKIGG